MSRWRKVGHSDASQVKWEEPSEKGPNRAAICRPPGAPSVVTSREIVPLCRTEFNRGSVASEQLGKNGVSAFSLDVHLAAVATLGRQGETPGCVGDIGGLDRTTSPRLPELPSDLRLSPFRAPNESPGRVETERKNAMNHEIHETHEKDANRQNQLDSKQRAQSGNAIDDFSPVSGRCSFSCISCISWFDRFGEGPPTFPGCQKLGGSFGFAPSAVRAVPSRAHIGKRSSLVTRHPPLATTGQKWPCRPTARKMVQSITKSKQNPAIRPEFRHVNDQLPTHDRACERAD